MVHICMKLATLCGTFNLVFGTAVGKRGRVVTINSSGAGVDRELIVQQL